MMGIRALGPWEKGQGARGAFHMDNIDFWVDYEEVGRPQEPGTYPCLSRKIMIEISPEVYQMWAETMFASLLPIMVVRPDWDKKDSIKYIADMPEIIIPEGVDANRIIMF
jgi:hypothetical protein